MEGKTTPDWMHRELAKFKANSPIESAWLPPASWYTTSEFYSLEEQTVFQNNWLIAARSEQVATPGQYITGQIGKEPYIITRDEQGKLHAFYNVCRHHAAEVACGEGKLQAFTCPYHGWTYKLNGTLQKAPELGAIKDFNRHLFSLVPMSVAEWGRFIFLALTNSPRNIEKDLAPLKPRLEAMAYTRLKFIARRSYTLACNWKVFIDNYLDGGYHVSYLHKGLSDQLELDSYQTEIFNRLSIQSGAGKTTENPQPTPQANSQQQGEDFSERIGSQVLYAWIYPNFIINRYGPMMDTNWVIPRGRETTEVIFDYYFDETKPVVTPEFIERSIAASHTVQIEDSDICESVQRGLRSSSYDQGRYSVTREAGELHFHRLLKEDLLGE